MLEALPANPGEHNRRQSTAEHREKTLTEKQLQTIVTHLAPYQGLARWLRIMEVHQIRPTLALDGEDCGIVL